MGRSGYPINRDAMVDNGIVLNRIIVDDGGPVIHVPHFGHGQPAMTQIVVGKIVDPYERVVFRAKTKIEIQAYIDAVKSESHASDEIGSRGQRRPTTTRS